MTVRRSPSTISAPADETSTAHHLPSAGPMTSGSICGTGSTNTRAWCLKSSGIVSCRPSALERTARRRAAPRTEARRAPAAWRRGSGRTRASTGKRGRASGAWPAAAPRRSVDRTWPARAGAVRTVTDRDRHRMSDDRVAVCRTSSSRARARTVDHRSSPPFPDVDASRGSRCQPTVKLIVTPDGRSPAARGSVVIASLRSIRELNCSRVRSTTASPPRETSVCPARAAPRPVRSPP